jgi:formate hydrogenlyase subunit 3/multisubunit Na+/H+ antiporter MnhD subunit
MSLWLYMVFGLLVVGFGIKSAIVPMHTWLPDAHPEAPSPISAMLSGMLIETGLYGLCRVLFLVFKPPSFSITIAALSVLTMCFANLLALLQPDIKRLLAYSSIAQMGYMLVGLSAGSAYGILGLTAHVFNHSLMKGLAFLSSGSLVHITGTREIEKMKGVGRMMPITTLTLFIALLGLGGVPTTSGFISKFILFNSALGAGMWWLALIGVINSAFSMAYYLRVMKILVSSPAEGGQKIKEAPSLMVAVTVVMAALIILFGVYPAPVIGLADTASRALVDGLGKYIGAVL